MIKNLYLVIFGKKASVCSKICKKREVVRKTKTNTFKNCNKTYDTKPLTILGTKSMRHKSQKRLYLWALFSIWNFEESPKEIRCSISQNRQVLKEYRTGIKWSWSSYNEDYMRMLICEDYEWECPVLVGKVWLISNRCFFVFFPLLCIYFRKG